MTDIDSTVHEIVYQIDPAATPYPMPRRTTLDRLLRRSPRFYTARIEGCTADWAWDYIARAHMVARREVWVERWVCNGVDLSDCGTYYPARTGLAGALDRLLPRAHRPLRLHRDGQR